MEEDPETRALISQEWLKEEMHGLRVMDKIKRLELICSVHWPEYDWKLLRVKFMDHWQDPNNDNLHAWQSRMATWLWRGRQSRVEIAKLSVQL